MKIQEMFKDDINRNINGVIQVTQQDETTERELKEYVITRELRRHFINFFNHYNDAFSEPTNDIGVWISGFFGSGKSHFLKILSFLLGNKTINGIKAVELFREKFEDDPATFMLIDNSTKNETETILFNIEEEGFSVKDETVVKRIFAKMFYNHLGFYGEDLKVARLEQFIDKKGKTEEFRRKFEERNGESWISTRNTFGFFEDDVVPTLMDVLGMSKNAAENWFNGTEKADLSTTQLISEIKEYVDTKPDNFRLIFMADEVGQYIGTHTDLLLDLQTIVESLGRECRGKVWVICTGQEALDEIIKVRMDAFSKIQARFKTRLSLSSSAVDEVIQKRLLKKNPEAEELLYKSYENNEIILKNLFTFKESMLDLKGFSNETEFVENYPFVPYQFMLIQKIFNEVRKHGAVGKHYSAAERSMLDGFQIVVKSIQEKNESAIAPLYPFYDSIHTFLDGSIRRVIERCERAADNGDGIELYDIKVLKLLYLLRYIDNDMPANLDNIVILMADDISTDKITLRQQIQASLDRLKNQNYIDRRGEVYLFLTDEEQDIARDIYVNTNVDTAKIIERIGRIIFGDIYTSKKYRYDKYDFQFDELVDDVAIGGSITGKIKLRFLTVASDEQTKDNFCLTMSSHEEAIVVLSETRYFELLEKAEKIHKYIKQRNINQLPKTVQDIIRDHQDEATKYEQEATKELERAITEAQFYVAGEVLDIKSSNPVNMIDEAMKYLVEHVYDRLDLIKQNAESDEDIINVLHGNTILLNGVDVNQEAAAEIESHLDYQKKYNITTSMEDIQSKYQAKPYGWKEIDIAAVIAILIYQQKVTIKYNGATIHADNKILVDLLRKKSERNRTIISLKQSVTTQKMRIAKEILREYFDIMDVPDDEEGVISLTITKFSDKKKHYEELKSHYVNHNYPDEDKINEGLKLIDLILSQSKDNISLIDKLVASENDLYDNKDDMQRVEDFFSNQVQLFDSAVQLKKDIQEDINYLQENKEVLKALEEIDLITSGNNNSSEIYRKIPTLNDLIITVNNGHNKLLESKKSEVINILDKCKTDIENLEGSNKNSSVIKDNALVYLNSKKQEIEYKSKIALLDAQIIQLWNYRDNIIKQLKHVDIENNLSVNKPEDSTQKEKNIKSVYRQQLFNPEILMNQNDIDSYIENIRSYLTDILNTCDGIKLY